MNQSVETILTRRSVRSYRPDPIAETELTAIIDAGLYAPSAAGRQSRHLCVVVNPNIIDEINTQLKQSSQLPGYDAYKFSVTSDDYAINFCNAPVFAIVSVADGMPDADGAVMLENMFLAAHSLGLGSCWINQLNPLSGEPGFRQLLTRLGVPQDYRVIGCGCFGHPDKAPPSPAPRKANAYCIVK